MSEYKTIEQALNSCGQSKLQDIVYRIIDCEYNYPKNLVYLGGAKNDDKTRWGTPDVFFQLDNGSYVFVEITTQKTGLNKKILNDLEKCKQEAKNNKIDVSKVIYVCSFKPTIKNLETYSSKCDEFCNSNAFELWGIDRLANLLTSNYRNLAVDELNVRLTLGSMQTVDEYLQSQKFDVSQTHEFLYREAELEEIVSSLLAHKTVLLYGCSGCGKTRLCFQAAKVLKEKYGFAQTYFIKNAVASTLNDLQITSGGEKTLFILDDVNRIPYLIDFLTYSKTNNNFFVLATVRDYAFDEIKKNLLKKGYDSELTSLLINALSEEQQNEIVKKILPNANYDVLRAIQNISKGNLRFSIMCAETIKTSKQIPKDLKNLLERYFTQIEVDLNSLKIDAADKSYQRSLIVLSLLHRIIIPVNDERRKNTFRHLLSELGIEYDQFMDSMIFWDQHEIIGISFSGQVYEIKDQILANYLFYKLVFECREISFSSLLNTLFPEYRSAFVEMLQSIVPIYGFANTPIEQEFKQSWLAIEDELKIVPFLEAFSHLIPLETLNYIKEHLSSSNSWIDILGGFEATQYDKIAVDLLIEILRLKPADLDLEKTVKLFGIHQNSFKSGLSTQIYLLRKLMAIIQDNDVALKLFLRFCQELLNFNFRFDEFHGNTLTMFETHIIPVECAFEMRSVIWEGLFSLFSSSYGTEELIRILSLFRFIPRDGLPDEYAEILKRDQQYITKRIAKIDLCLQSFEKKIIIKRMLECCYPEENEKYKELVSALEEDAIFRIFSFVDSRRNRYYMIDPKQKETYEKDFGKLLSSIHMPFDFFTYVKKVEKFKTNDGITPPPLNYFLQYIHDYYPEKYLGTLKLLFEDLPDSSLMFPVIIRNAIDVSDWASVFSLIQQANIGNRNVWLLELFSQLDEKNLNEALYIQCLDLICDEILTDHEDNIRCLNILDYLPFERYKCGFIGTVFETIDAAGDIGLGKYRVIEHCYYAEFLNEYQMTFDDFYKLLDEKASLYVDLFFTMVKKGVLISSGGFAKFLSLKDEGYLYRYYDIYFEPSNLQDRHCLTINLLRGTTDPCRMMLNIYKRAIDNTKFIYPYDELEEIIKANFNESSIAEFIKMFLQEFHHEKRYLTHLTNVMCCMNKDWQLTFVEKLIESKIDIQIFQDLPVFGHPLSWSGYESDMLESRVSMLHELLTRMKPDLSNMEYLKCLNDRLRSLKTQIEEAKLKELYEFGKRE